MIVPIRRSRRHIRWIIICAALVVGLAVILLLLAPTLKPHKALNDVAPTPPMATAPTAESPSLSESEGPPQIAVLPVTGDPSAYARAVAEDLFNVDQVLAGDKTAPDVSETGCKMTIPS